MKEIEWLDSKVKADIENGAKVGFNTGLRIEPDLSHMENCFFLERAKNGKPDVSVIDQGKTRISNVGNLIRKGKILRST